MRRTICGLIGAFAAFSGASAYGKIFDPIETWRQLKFISHSCTSDSIARNVEAVVLYKAVVYL